MGLEVALESSDFSGHCHGILIIKGFGAPHSLHLKTTVLAHGRGQQGLVSNASESSVEVIFILATNVLLEVEAGADVVGIE